MSLNKYSKDCVVHWRDTKRLWGLPITFTHYALVEKPGKWIKLFVEKGLLTTSIEEVHLFKIDDFDVYESAFDKLFRVGTITVYHNDSSSQQFRLLHIKKPYQVHALLAEQVEKAKADKKLYYTEFQRQ